MTAVIIDGGQALWITAGVLAVIGVVMGLVWLGVLK